MNRGYILAFALLFWSCGDSAIDIETIEFDDIAIEQCGTASISTDFFFKRNGTEALILVLPDGFLQNEVTENQQSRTISNQAQLIFRIFDESVPSSYFCADLPPANPNVIEEINATEGTVILNTTQIDELTYEHTLQLQGVTFINEKGERLTDLTLNDFGTFRTTN